MTIQRTWPRRSLEMMGFKSSPPERSKKQAPRRCRNGEEERAAEIGIDLRWACRAERRIAIASLATRRHGDFSREEVVPDLLGARMMQTIRCDIASGVA